jgi:glutathione S-transferase
MKLHMNPVTTTSRPILLLLQDEAIPCDLQIVDLMAGEHKQEPYISLNPAGQIPILEDGALTLTESSAILKYIADKFDSPAYPKELKARAKVNEMMDWFNTSFSRNYCYGLVYPQLMPAVYGGRSDESRTELLDRGRIGSREQLRLLNDHWLGSGKAYLCGQDITLADYLGIGCLTLGEMTRCAFSEYPNVQRWLETMKSRPSWARVHQPFYQVCASFNEKPFVTV